MTRLLDREEFAGSLHRDARILGLQLDEACVGKLLDYLEQMVRWNRTYNLTAIREPEAMRVQHLVDSLAVIPSLRDRLANDGVPAGAPARIMDVGSGGGLPGVVLAIVHPEWQVCCVDAVEKKTAFVRQMAGVLGLPNLEARHTRVEQLPPADCDLVISRAFSSLENFAALAGLHVREGGTLAAMKGKRPDNELADLLPKGEWELQELQPLQVPGMDAERCIAYLARA